MAAATTLIAKSVILATSWAPLLSGLLWQCHNAEDPTCRGGVAAFRAILRQQQQQLAAADDGQADPIPAVHLQLLDKNNAFVHMHPLGLSVNRLILSDLMGLDVFASPPSILTQNKLDYDVSSQDISNLQTSDMPLLLTNVAIPPGNSWHPYAEAVHFDESTGLAVLSVSKTDEELNVPQVESTLGSLRYVRKVNEENGCVETKGTKYGEYLSHGNSTSFAGAASGSNIFEVKPDAQCWLPVVYHSDDPHHFVTFLDGMMALAPDHRPAMVIDTGGNFEEYYTPKVVDGIWVASHPWDSRNYFHDKLDIQYGGPDGPKLVNAEYLSIPLSPLPEEVKDEIYRNEILALHMEAQGALDNNPVIGHSTEMPVTRDSSKYRPCKSGECPIGNLYTDAARWYAKADVSFITSGGVRGPGWPEGEVTVADAWTALPFPNDLCTGTMNGVHLFQLLNYSYSVSTFEGEDTEDGGKTLQISGARVTYNTELSPSRIISIEIANRETGDYEPIERLKMYKFATDSYLCTAYTPYPELLGADSLVVEGEEPGKIESVLYQEILSMFLTEKSSPELYFKVGTEGRLMNDTSVTEYLDLVQTEEGCEPGTYWKGAIETCLSCPTDFDVGFTEEEFHFEMASGVEAEAAGANIVLKNHEQFSVAVIPKSVPDWLYFSSEDYRYKGTESPAMLGPGETLLLSMEVDPSKLEEGTVYVTIGFGVLDGGDYLGCVGQDATFDITMKVYPEEQKNQLGSISAVGFTLFGVVAFTSIFFAAYIAHNRTDQAVKALQPIFLTTICFGVLVMGSAIITISIDDGMASEKGCDISCMATPWLISMGFTVAISALFAKLWRINRVVGAGFRRVQVTPFDVAKPMIIMFILNLIILLVWTFVDPLRWERFEVDGASWNTYGRCVGANGQTWNWFLIVLIILNFSVFGLALHQAWKARKVSAEFSEAKTVGIALYSWLQLCLVGVPVLFLIDRDNTTASYFLVVALIFAVCMSMLLIIFVPLLLQIRRARKKLRKQAKRGTAPISGKTNSTEPEQTRYSTMSGGTRISGLNIDPAKLSAMSSGRISGLHNQSEMSSQWSQPSNRSLSNRSLSNRNLDDDSDRDGASSIDSDLSRVNEDKSPGPTTYSKKLSLVMEGECEDSIRHSHEDSHRIDTIDVEEGVLPGKDENEAKPKIGKPRIEPQDSYQNLVSVLET